MQKDEKESLERLAQVGFAYVKLLESIPDETSIKYQPFFKRRGTRNRMAGLIRAFSSISLAIAKGYSAEERAAYISRKGGKK